MSENDDSSAAFDIEVRQIAADGRMTIEDIGVLSGGSCQANGLAAVSPGDDILSELRGIDAAILTRSVDIMISRLRQKLGDNQKPPRFIQTIWGRGYSFVGVPKADV